MNCKKHMIKEFLKNNMKYVVINANYDICFYGSFLDCVNYIKENNKNCYFEIYLLDFDMEKLTYIDSYSNYD